ncbi:MAG: hypothetical protein K0Q68_1950 [Moraxellaceae bacterium]|nr:hypothetical protein [Moraxellaceae bacterium]
MPKLLDIHKKKRGFSSDRKLATALLDKHGDLNWGTKQAPSLAVRLGLINKGATDWWHNRPDLAKALADLLDTSPEDLGIHPQEAGDFHRFPEFPELAPLDLARELPCDLGRPVSRRDGNLGEEFEPWLGQGPASITVKQPASGVHWLHFPPGRGADLFWAHLHRHSKYESRRANTIHDAHELLMSPRHLILRIDADGGDPDLHTLAAMHPDMALLIVAPHAAPLRPNPGSIQTLYLWERFNGPLDARREFDLTTDPFEQIRSFEWRLHPDWITRLVTWIEKRANAHQTETLFTAEEILRWLEKFPYLKRQIRGPGDILHLSSLLHSVPSSKWPKATNREAGRKLLQHILPTSTGIQNDYRELSIAAWRSETAEWGAPLPQESWEQLAKAHSDSATEKLNALVDADDRATRVKLAGQLKRSPSRLNLARLTEQKMLLTEAVETYSLRPRFMPWLLARDHVIECMTHQELESWAPQCFDPKRRIVVDAALDALTLDQLLPIGERLPASLAGNAAAIAAAEALFYTIGRRIQKETEIPPALLTLAPRVLNQLDMDNALGLPGPWSRDIREKDAQIEWIATCWEWSLSPRPENLPARFQSSWLFPGWANDLDEADDWESIESLVEKKRDVMEAILKPRLQPNLQPILQRAEALTGILAKPPTFPPAPLKPFLIIAGAKGRWHIEPEWWKAVFDSDWIENLVSDKVNQIAEERIPALLGAMLDYVAATYTKSRDISTHFMLSPLRTAILRRLPPESLAHAFSKEQLQILLSLPEALPPALRGQALELMLSSNNYADADFEKLIFLTEEGDAQRLLRCLDTAYWKAAAQRIWQLMPHQAKFTLSNASNENPTTIHALLITCPDLSYSLPLICEHRNIFQNKELQAWARERLPSAGLHSQELMRLLIPR